MVAWPPMSTSAPAAADGDRPASPGSWLRDRSLAAGLAVLASMVFLGAIIRLGWLSDDAFVSFRAIDNLVSGRGLVSNVGERVQGFTNPLWTLLVALAYWPSGDIYGSAMVLSLLCCLGTVYFVWRLHGGGWRTAWTLLLLAMSVRFAGFSTGGLENCLAHLLLAAFSTCRTRQPATSPWFWLLGGLVVLNRLDHALLVLPALGLFAARDWRQSWRRCLLGLGPLAAWFLFAIVYYGFPYPNTAYAKLNTAIPLGAHIARPVLPDRQRVHRSARAPDHPAVDPGHPVGQTPVPAAAGPRGGRRPLSRSTSAGSAGTSCRDGS